MSGLVDVRTFTDTSNGRSYCLLMEVRDQDGNSIVDNGFGTFIMYNNASRQLSHQAVPGQATWLKRIERHGH